MNDEIENIYERWHDFARNRDVDSLIELYADHGVFESPLVPAILDQPSGVLHGRDEIFNFLKEGTQKRPNDLVRWHRSGKYFTDGKSGAVLSLMMFFAAFCCLFRQGRFCAVELSPQIRI